MALFAHVESGLCVDLQPSNDEAEYRKRFSGIDQKTWQVVQVPDSTEPFAKWNGDGTVTNPPKPQPGPPPASTTKKQISDQIAVLQALANSLP